MADPIGDLINVLKTKDGLTTVNLSGVRSQVVPDALIIRPNEPWIEQDRFCAHLERYLAVCTVSASTPDEGVSRLLTMATAVIDNLPEGWDWESVGGPIIDESTGTAFLVAPVRLTYKGA